MEQSRTRTETVRTIVQHDNLFKFQQRVGKGGSGGNVEKWIRWTRWRSGEVESWNWNRNWTIHYRLQVLYVDNKQARFLNLYNPIFTCVIHTRPMPRVRELYYWQLQINPSPITNHQPQPLSPAYCRMVTMIICNWMSWFSTTAGPITSRLQHTHVTSHPIQDKQDH